MMRKTFLVAAGLLLAALSISCNTSSVLRESKAARPISGVYCDPEIKTYENPIIFVHGLHEGKWVWEGMSEQFCKSGYATFRFDLRRYAKERDMHQNSAVNIFDYLKDVESAIDEVTRKYRQAPILIGHSMGGLLSLRAGRHKRLQSLVLITPAPSSEVRVSPLPWLAKKNLSEIFKTARRILFDETASVRFRRAAGRIREWKIEKQQEYFQRLVPEPTRVIRNLISQNIRVPPGSVSVPILVVSGSVDDIVGTEIPRRIAAMYNADFMEFKGNGHFIIIEPGWEDAADAIHAWLLPAKSKTPLPAVAASTP